MKVLFIPIYSMRSYETGKYSILKDGNFQLTMARVLASDFESIMITVPEESSDYEELIEKYKNADRLKFIRARYGANAVETRESFWKENFAWVRAQFEIEGNWDVLITDITGYPGTGPAVYNLNITKLPELDRPYIDKFFETDLKSIEKSLFTTVLNPRQREYILEVRPDLLDNVILNTKCAHEALLPRFIEQKPPAKSIFWPFRISDRAYKFAEFMNAFEAQGLHNEGYEVVITDPNDSIAVTRAYITKIKPSKLEYYQILSSKPTIVMLDDIDTVLHPGTVEFLYYGCPVITFPSELIPNPNSIPDLGSLRTALQNLKYNAVNYRPFVYNVFTGTGRMETDPYYNEEFISVRSY